jgi:hypothetical protein
MAEPNVSLTHSRKCTAHSSRTGKPCQRYAIMGATVCQTHGGSAPQVKRKAEQRLREMVDPMISRLNELAMQTDNPKVAADCVRDALDRAGIGALVQAKVKTAEQRNTNAGGITVNIGFIAQVPQPDELASTLQTIDVIALPPTSGTPKQ